GIAAEHVGVGIEHGAVAAVTDGVGGYLHPALAGTADDGLVGLGLPRQQAVVAGVVAVLLLQRRAAAAQRAIREQLDAVHPQPAAFVGVQAVVAQVGEGIAVAAGVGGDAQRQPALVGKAAHQRQVRARDAHVVHAGQA